LINKPQLLHQVCPTNRFILRTHCHTNIKNHINYNVFSPPPPLYVPSFPSSKISRSIFKEGKGKGKAVPLQASTSTEGSRKLRFPDFMTTAQDGVKVVSLTHRPLLPPGNAPGTHFCYRLSRPQDHSVIGRILCQ